MVTYLASAKASDASRSALAQSGVSQEAYPHLVHDGLDIRDGGQHRSRSRWSPRRPPQAPVPTSCSGQATPSRIADASRRRARPRAAPADPRRGDAAQHRHVHGLGERDGRGDRLGWSVRLRLRLGASPPTGDILTVNGTNTGVFQVQAFAAGARGQARLPRASTSIRATLNRHDHQLRDLQGVGDRVRGGGLGRCVLGQGHRRSICRPTAAT